MSLAKRIAINVKDAATFGLSAWLRHFARLRRDRMARITVPGIGPVHVRAGESDFDALRQVFAWREYQIRWPVALADRIAAQYRAMIARGETPVIIDAGANIGAASLWFAHAYPEARIVAVEPDPGNVAMLRRNVAGRGNIVVMDAAIGAERGHAALVDRGQSWAVQTRRADAGVPVVTVDDALAASGGDALFLVKVDIEGFESDLFAGNTGWLDKAYVVIVEPHDWLLPGQMTSRSFQRAIADHPFEMFMRGENIIYARV